MQRLIFISDVYMGLGNPCIDKGVGGFIIQCSLEVMTLNTLIFGHS